MSVEGIRAFTVTRTDGTQVSLDAPEDLGDDADFVDGLKPVFYFWTPDRIAFVRPQRDPSDVNFPDWIVQSPNTPIRVDLTVGDTIDVTVEASTDKTKTGTDVDFSATVQGGDAHGEITYDWDFDDGRRSTTAEPAHAWNEKGTYDVVLDVSTEDGFTGSDTVQVEVGERPDPPEHHHLHDQDPPPGGNGPDNNPATGPDDSNGTAGGEEAGDTDQGTPGDAEDTDQHHDQAGDGGPDAEPDAETDVIDDGSITGVLLTSAPGEAATALDSAPLTAPAARQAPEPARDPLVYTAIIAPLLLIAGAMSEYRLVLAGALTGLWRRRGRTAEGEQ